MIQIWSLPVIIQMWTFYQWWSKYESTRDDLHMNEQSTSGGPDMKSTSDDPDMKSTSDDTNMKSTSDGTNMKSTIGGQDMNNLPVMVQIWTVL